MAKRLPAPNGSSSDQLLMLCIQQKNTYAFEILYARYRPCITGFCLRMLRNEEKARDVVQEVFLKIVQKRDSYKQTKKFSSWIYRIATNLCLDEIRKSKLRQNVTGEEAENVPAKAANEPASILEKEEKEKAVKAAIGKLDPDNRAVILLHQYSGLTYDEIAESLDKKPNWVKWRLKLAYDELAVSLKMYSAGNSCHEEERKPGLSGL